MSQVVSTIVDVAEVVVGIALAPVTGGASLLISAAGVGDIAKTFIAEKNANDAKAQQDNNPVGNSGSTTDLSGAGTGGAGGNTPGATSGTSMVPNEMDVINERSDAANLSQIAYEEQGLSSIQNLQLQEAKQESSIIAGAATRGLKLEGSPLYQLNAQKQAGATAISGAETAFNLGDKAQRESNLASYNSGLLNMSNSQLQINTDLSNMWLQSFTNVINNTTSFLGKFWNPAQNMQNVYNPATGGPQGEGGIGYYGY
jgi:hypothetical protein